MPVKSFALQPGDLIMGNRVRIEERWGDSLDGVLVRARYRLRCAHPLGTSPAYRIASNEVFVNLNDKRAGPVRGFEQNRLFGGVGLHVGSHVRVELGYHWRTLDRRDRGGRDDHVIAFNLFFDTYRKLTPVPAGREAHH